MAPTPSWGIGTQWITSMMIDSCIVQREPLQQFTGTLDLSTGLRVVPDDSSLSELLYSGKCLFKRRTKGEEAPVELGEEPLLVTDYKILFPPTFSDIRLHDFVTVVSSRDSYLNKHVMRIIDVEFHTHLTYRSVFAKDMSAAGSLYARD